MAAVKPAPQGAAETRAAADESEQALRLTGVEDVVGQCPELADQKDAQYQAEEVEGNRHPHRAGPQERPEDDEQPDDDSLRDGDDVLAGHAANGIGVDVHDDADQDAGDEEHVRQIVSAECGDELRTGDGLQDVVRRHREKRVGEHQRRRRRLVGANGRHEAEHPVEQRAHPETVAGACSFPRQSLPRAPDESTCLPAIMRSKRSSAPRDR